MRERGSRLWGYLFILIVGLLPSLVSGGLVVMSGISDRNAADNLARYRGAPVCGADAAADCRAEIAATVVSTYTRSLMQTKDPHIVVGATGDQIWDVTPVSGTLALAPGQPIQAEQWQEQIVLLRGTDGRTLETAAYPVRVEARSAGNSGLARLGGVLAILWAIMFLVLFGVVFRAPAGPGRQAGEWPERPPDS